MKQFLTQAPSQVLRSVASRRTPGRQRREEELGAWRESPTKCASEWGESWGESWEYHGNIMGESWEYHGNVIEMKMKEEYDGKIDGNWGSMVIM